MIQQFHFWVCTQQNGKQGTEQIHTHRVHSSIFHNRDKVEGTQGPDHRGAVTQDAMEYYSASNRKEILTRVTQMNSTLRRQASHGDSRGVSTYMRPGSSETHRGDGDTRGGGGGAV